MASSPHLSIPTSVETSKEDLSKDVEKGSDETLGSNEKGNTPAQGQNLPPDLKKKASETADPNLVGWEENDPDNPWNWPHSKKWFITAQLGLLAFVASLASSITAPANYEIGKYVGVSQEVSVLTISLFVLGFVFGPSIWGPTSEIWGRRWSMLPATFIMGLFGIGFAVAEDAQTVFICRFFMGLFGSAPVSNVSAALGDLWEPKERGKAVVWYAVSVVGGPTLGPTIGAALTVNEHLGW
jgi:hypothetical protein